MSLFGLIDYEGSSSSSSESDEETATEESSASNLGKNSAIDVKEESEKLVLPSPLLEPSEPSSSSKEFGTRTYQQTSIFYNPFKAEEKRKLDVLEKHVHLTKSVPSSKNNKRICYKFQKGKCRFGDNCRFAHATNIIKPESVNQNNDVTNAPGDDAHISRTELPYNPQNDDDQWEEAKPMAKKRRVGVTDSLVPPKKAMNAYEQQKSKEKP